MKEILPSAIVTTVAESKLPLLVDIFTPQCAPCRALAPILEELANEFTGQVDFVKSNAMATDDAPAACSALGIRSVPTLLLFNSGREISRKTGLLSKATLSAWITENSKITP